MLTQNLLRTTANVAAHYCKRSCGLVQNPVRTTPNRRRRGYRRISYGAKAWSALLLFCGGIIAECRAFENSVNEQNHQKTLI